MLMYLFRKSSFITVDSFVLLELFNLVHKAKVSSSTEWSKSVRERLFFCLSDKSAKVFEYYHYTIYVDLIARSQKSDFVPRYES